MLESRSCPECGRPMDRNGTFEPQDIGGKRFVEQVSCADHPGQHYLVTADGGLTPVYSAFNTPRG
jgi:hypothetical protein